VSRDPVVEQRRTQCRRCGTRFNPDLGFCGVHESRGRTPVEQIANGRVYYLCDECTASLKSFMRVAPAPLDDPTTQ
jgi:rubredoxin